MMSNAIQAKHHKHNVSKSKTAQGHYSFTRAFEQMEDNLVYFLLAIRKALKGK